MRMNQLARVAVLVVLSCVLGCTWVKPVEGTEAVALVKAGAAASCKKLGKTVVQVKDRLGFINRNDEKVAKELLTLARNQAVTDGADTLVAESDEVDGRQTFGMYKCR